MPIGWCVASVCVCACALRQVQQLSYPVCMGFVELSVGAVIARVCGDWMLLAEDSERVNSIAYP